MATKRKTAPKVTDAEKAARFRRLAEKRTVRAIKAIRTLAKLANPRGYNWTPEQAQKIVAAVGAEVNALQERLTTPGGNGGAPDFSL